MFQILGLFLTGVLAGIEFIVRYGVQPSLTALDDHSHLLARQSIVRRLRVVVPAVMLPAVIVTVVASILANDEPGAPWRWAAVVALLALLLFSFLGTVPINIKVNDWNPDSPPSDWKSVVSRWQLIDVFRSSAAILAFALSLVAIGVQLATG